MKQAKFSLADMFTLVIAFIFGCFCFLNFNLLSLGETETSIGRAFLIALLLFWFAYLAKRLKMTYKPSIIKVFVEYIFLFLFAIVAFNAIFPFSHLFAVYNEKTKIQKDLKYNIKESIDMFDKYKEYADDRLDKYEKKLNSVVKARGVNPSEYTKYGFKFNADNKKQIDDKMIPLKIELYPELYNEIKEKNSYLVDNTKNKMDNWNAPIPLIGPVIGFVYFAINISSVITIDKEFSSYRNSLEQFSKFRALHENASNFDESTNFNDATYKIRNLGEPTLVSITIALLLYIFMLLSYYITDRRYPIKMFFRRKSINDL